MAARPRSAVDSAGSCKVNNASTGHAAQGSPHGSASLSHAFILGGLAMLEGVQSQFGGFVVRKDIKLRLTGAKLVMDIGANFGQSSAVLRDGHQVYERAEGRCRDDWSFLRASVHQVNDTWLQASRPVASIHGQWRRRRCRVILETAGEGGVRFRRSQHRGRHPQQVHAKVVAVEPNPVAADVWCSLNPSGDMFASSGSLQSHYL